MRLDIRHIFVAMIIGMMFAASCSSEPDSGGLDSELREEIKFEFGTGTRVSITTNPTLTELPFSLYCDVNSDGAYFEGAKPIILNRWVKFNSKSGKWEYTPAQYWLMGKEHSFVAIHPAIELNPDITDIDYSDSKLTFIYNLPEDIGTVKDMLVATHRRKHSINNSEAVKFNFSHTLTQINIASALKDALMYDDVTEDNLYPDNPDYWDNLGNHDGTDGDSEHFYEMNENEYIEFHKVEFYGIQTKATFNFIPDSLTGGNSSTDTFTATYDITNGEKSDRPSITYKKPRKTTNNGKPVSLLDGDDTVVILPQTFDAASKSKIVMTYTVNQDTTQRRISIPLAGAEWKAGKIYTYKFQVSKVCKGQIKPGSLEIQIDDFRLGEDEDDSWIDGGEHFKFGIREDGTWGPV